MSPMNSPRNSVLLNNTAVAPPAQPNAAISSTSEKRSRMSDPDDNFQELNPAATATMYNEVTIAPSDAS